MEAHTRAHEAALDDVSSEGHIAYAEG